MGTCLSTIRNNEKSNLELYLNDVYENECEFKIKKEEIEFIRTGIETLTQDIVDKVLESKSFERILRNLSVWEDPRNTITNLYFLGECDSFCKRYPHPHGKSSILKVGSFYEGTRNGFPDEFDYIFLLYCIKDTPSKYKFLSLEETIHPIIKEVTAEHGECLHYGANGDAAQQGRRVLYFDKYVKPHGPASMLEFVYINSSGQSRYINVDLTPAVRLTYDINMSSFPFHASESETFKKEIRSARNYLSIRGEVSITETEVCFIKNVLSKKHIKAFRILKHLINGHDAEKLKDLNPGKRIFSSYDIKLLMIRHHDCCENNNTTDIGPCVLQVFNEMIAPAPYSQLLQNMQYYLYLQNDYIEYMVKYLRFIETSKDSYDYERYKTVSIAKYCQDREQLCLFMFYGTHSDILLFNKWLENVTCR